MAINFEGENPVIFPDYCPYGHGHDNILMAYSILILQNSLNAIISSKDCTFLLRESLTGSSSVHILLQPYDLLNDLKINNKLIYSALYETYLSIWDIIWYKTLKSWPAPRSQLQSAECTKFLGPHVWHDILPESHWIIYSSTSIIWTWLCKWLQQPDFIPKWELYSCY